MSVEQALAAIRQRLSSGDTESVAPVAAELVRFAVSCLAGGRPAEAGDILERLSALLPTHAAALHYRGVCRQLGGDLDGAEALIRRALALDPDRADAWCNLGATLIARGDPDQAADCFRRALRRDPGNLNARNNLGAIHLHRREWREAGEMFKAVVLKAPDMRGASVNLAMALTGDGQFERAIAICTDVLARHGDDLDACLCLADALAKSGKVKPAIDILRRAVAFSGETSAVNNLANLLSAEGANVEAAGLYRSILDREPAQATVLSNLAGSLAALGRAGEAVETYRAALRLAPDPAVHSNLLLALQGEPHATAASLLEEARSWDGAHGRAARCMCLNTPDPLRRLRVGYLSPDFRRHPVGFFLPGVVAAHDRDRVEVCCYHDHPQSDEVTDSVRAGADRWREVQGLRDEALIEQIQADGIDILVECAGHSGRNRLAALARAPAPVQVTWLLGHGGTTGLAAMDYVLADSALAPEGHDGEFSETVIRLPIFAPFRPDPSWPEVSPPPGGAPLLACMANPARIGDGVVAVWSRLLERLPGVRIVLKHGAFGEAGQEAYWRRRFAALGDGLILEGVPGGWLRHMDFYGQVSLVLDTFPITGATSTLIPLWMGVPVVSLAGAHSAGRFGRSILRAVGLDDLIAHSFDGYVDKAAGLAGDGGRLAALRGSLRGRMASGAVCDVAGFARSAEGAYRSMWREWCARQGGTAT